MNEDVAAPYFAEQKPLGSLIEEGDHVPGKEVRTPEPETQDEVLKKSLSP